MSCHQFHCIIGRLTKLADWKQCFKALRGTHVWFVIGGEDLVEQQPVFAVAGRLLIDQIVVCEVELRSIVVGQGARVVVALKLLLQVLQAGHFAVPSNC